MNRWLIPLMAISVGLLAGAACAGEAVPTPTATATPSVVQEWELEGVQTFGTTVTVSLRVFAGIDVQVTLDGRQADEVRPALPTIEYIFNDVGAGSYTVEVRDVAGYNETAEVVVSTAPPLSPWQAALIRRLENEPVADPPASLTRYEYKGQAVYYLPPRCCDMFSDLYDDSGNIIGHPDGGITGQGDGRGPDVLAGRESERFVWKDRRSHDPGLVQVPAPIESVDILTLESFPPQYNLAVASGLPNGCASFAGYYLNRDDTTIRVDMINWKPAASDVACTADYRTVNTTIPLGSDFVPGESYAAVVNDVTERFVAQ
ncbi:MAG: hypothetical protein IIB33_01720 [Chloroflexi bacterium]|nr:hypothetical protein [Chloroflexota bacterium]